MKIIQDISHKCQISSPVVMTVGNFDGMHLGHVAVLDRMKALAEQNRTQTAMISFENHPSTILRPNHPTLLICTPEHKLALFRKEKIDLFINLPFTLEFSHQTAREFLTTVMEKVPFSHLILGHDAKLGRDRQGDGPEMRSLAKEMHFHLEYLNVVKIQDHPVSSTSVRQAIQHGNFALAEKLLGRKYSIMSTIQEKRDGYLYIDATGLCLPPLGTYPVTLKRHGKGEVVLSENEPNLILIRPETAITPPESVEIIF
jgi:riboflavin kinase/FMN adenylyltransferase